MKHGGIGLKEFRNPCLLLQYIYLSLTIQIRKYQNNLSSKDCVTLWALVRVGRLAWDAQGDQATRPTSEINIFFFLLNFSAI